MGCFPLTEDTKKSLLPEAKYRFGDGAETRHCLDRCLQSGFRFAGVLNATHCRCGDELEGTPSTPSPFGLSPDSCSLSCPVSEFVSAFESGSFCFMPAILICSLVSANLPSMCSVLVCPVSFFPLTSQLLERRGNLSVACLSRRIEGEESVSGRECNRIDSREDRLRDDSQRQRCASGQAPDQRNLQSKSPVLHPRGQGKRLNRWNTTP